MKLQRITYKAGATPVSEFLYGHDLAAGRITTWSQQAGAQTPQLHSFGYDDADQLLSATVTTAGAPVNTYAYTYDPAENRLTEQAGVSSHIASYNALNQISTAPASARTNEWDAMDRLVAVTAGNRKTEFTYDGRSRLASLRLLINGAQASLRRFVWRDYQICEERDGAGAVTRRFFEHGVKIENGANAGTYFYTRDHLGSIREVTDSGGNVRARYAYDPFGRRTRVAGDLEADFGFTGMFFTLEAGLALATFRAYDPELGRWLSRDPLPDAEVEEGPNLYSYVASNPINLVDPLGLCCEDEKKAFTSLLQVSARNCEILMEAANRKCGNGSMGADGENDPESSVAGVLGDLWFPSDVFRCARLYHKAKEQCDAQSLELSIAADALFRCQILPCKPCPPPQAPAPTE